MIYNYDYFISYARKDNGGGFIDKFVERLVNNSDGKGAFESLLGNKPRVFFDKESIDNMDDWENRIRRAIATSRFLIVFISPSYFQSENCALEFEWWFEREKHLCLFGEAVAPIRIGEVHGFRDNGKVDVPQKLQNRFPHWVSELRRRHSSSDFWLPMSEKSEKSDESRIDNTLASLCCVSRDKVWRQNSASQSPSSSNYPQYNKNFVGRLGHLRTLNDNFIEHRVILLHGLRGSGKTELALAYGHTFAWDYRLGRIYIECQDEKSLVEAMFSSNRKPLPDMELQGSVNERFTMFLAYLSQRRNVILEENKKNERLLTQGTRLLLILDDVTNPELLNNEYFENLCKCDFVNIIVTTQEKPSDFGDFYQVPVDALTNLEALELLRTLHPFKDSTEKDTAHKVIRKFGRHAFRVEKIGTYLCSEGETYKDFFRKAREQTGYLAKTIDTKDFKTRHKKICDEVCLRPTLERITWKAKTLLYWAALFEPDSVALPWLGELAKIDGDDLSKGLKELKDYRLLVVPEEVRSGRETPLVQLNHIAREIVIEEMPNKFRLSALEQVGEKIDVLLAKDASSWFSGEIAWSLDSITDFCFGRYVETMRQKRSKSDFNLIRRFITLFELYLNHLKDYDRAREISQVLKELSQRWAGIAQNDLQASLALSAYNISLGDLYLEEKGNCKEAREYYRESLETLNKIVVSMPDDLRALRALSASKVKLGNLSNTEGTCDRAREYYKESLDILKKIVDRTPGDLQVLRALSNSCVKLGDSLEKEDPSQAIEYYKYSLEILKKIVACAPDALQTLRVMSSSYIRLGDLLEEKDRAQAIEFHKESLKIFKKVVVCMPDDLQSLHSLSDSHVRLGDLLEAEGIREQAIENYKESLEIFKKIDTLNPGDFQSLRTLSSSYKKIGNLLKAEKDYKQAEKYYKKSLEILKTIGHQLLYDWIVSYNNLGDLSNAEKDYKQAKEYYKKALKIQNKIAELTPDDK